ncbi:TetR/AcrR family transcriptional regulator [Kribbia dieselivorans]|uniref:TetR/AcrR family transcriptional regulator n=1 Tax=Kribbia dieselivorans TaxID=331526 RepID=UPI0009FB0193|nr:TetR/AcrR family transcriptional regulator [Kribbia dieselivorans]
MTPDSVGAPVRPTASTHAQALAEETVPPGILRLFTAAADAFSQKGFHATTTRDIASRAGLSPAGVYVHFSSKEDLLYRLSREGHVVARDALREAAAAASDPEDALRALVTSFAQWHAENYQLAHIVQYEFRHLSDEHRTEVLRLRKEIDSTFATVLRDGVEQGVFEVTDLRLTTLAITSMIVDVARWYHTGVSETPDHIATTYADLALRLVSRG